ncbi:MAG: ankyrin repeat domain-containing protein [Betaproteobacteria bacterium]
MSKGFFTEGPGAALEAAIVADDPQAIERALAAGAQVNARGRRNATPLMVAVDRLKPRAVTTLLARGADPNLKADDGTSAVSLAVENYRQAPELMEMLFAAGGNPNMRRPDDDPVIIRFVADHNCDYIRKMKNYGADLDIKTRAGRPLILSTGTAQDWDVVWCLIELGAKYSYDESSPGWPLTRTLEGTFPSPDSPIYPYKVKVWEFLKSKGLPVPPLNEPIQPIRR